MGYHGTIVHEIGPTAIKKKNYLTYWKEGSSGDNATAIKGDRGLQGKRGAEGDRGEAGPEGRIGQRGAMGPMLGRWEKMVEREILDLK